MKIVATRMRRITLAVFAITLSAVLGFSLLPKSDAESASVLVPTITIANVVDDVAGVDDGNADPGDTVEYTVTITNTAAAGAANDASGLNFSDTLDSNLTLVPGTLNASPIAGNDSYETVGNTQLQVAATQTVSPSIFVSGNVLTNDTDPGGPAPTAVALTNAATSQGGLVTLQTNGTFVYTPPVNFTGTDTFTYQATDGTANGTGTVSINVIGMVRYVKNDAAAGGNGRSNTPFNTLAAAQIASAGVTIYVFSGTGTTVNQAGGITLATNQRLIGSGVALTMPGITVNGVANPQILAAGAQPLITNTNAGGNGVNVGTATGVEIRGLNIAGNTNAIDATFTGAVAGSLVIANNTVSSSGVEGIDINGGSSGAISIAVDNTSVTSGSTGIDIQRTNGTVRVTSFSNNFISGNTTGAGVLMNTVIFDADPVTAGFQTVNANTLTIGQSGNGVSLAGINLQGILGDVSFSDLDIFADNGSALTAVSTGTFNAAAATGFRIVTTANAASFSSTNGAAADISTATIDLQLASLSSTNSTGAGVNLNTVLGTFSAPTGSAISSATGADFSISGATNPGVTYGGTISDDLGTLVSITGQTGGTKSFTGAITDGNDGDGNGITLTGNTGATISFSGGLLLSTGINPAFAATGGGTVNVCDENPCNAGATGALVNTITTTTGTALNVANTTIGASNLEFRSISANGAANGIVLNTTGSSGGLKVKGNSSGVCGGNVTQGSNTPATVTAPNSADCTGGTIASSSGVGILLTSTQNVSLTRMRVASGGDDGIRGTTVSSFMLTACLIENNGNAVGERGIDMSDLTGSGGLANTTVRGSSEHNVIIVNDTGTLSAFNVTNSQIATNNLTPVTGTGDDGIQVLNTGTGAMTVSVTQSAFTDNKGDHFQAATDASCTGSINVTFNNNTLVTTAGNDPQVVGGGITINPGDKGDITFSINNNNIQEAFDDTINLNLDPSSKGSPDPGTLVGTISNNIIGTAGVSASGSESSNTITAAAKGAGTMTVAITNNTIREWGNQYGIFLGDTEGTATANFTVTGNTLSATFPNLLLINGIRVDAGATAGPPNDTGVLCAAITANNATGTGNASNGDADIRLRQRFGTTIRLPGYAGANTATTAVNTFVAANNDPNGGSPPAAPTVTSAQNVAGGGGGFVGGAACTQPSLAQPFVEGGININGNSDINLSFLNASYQTPAELLASINPLVEPAKDGRTPETIAENKPAANESVLSENSTAEIAAQAVIETTDTPKTSYLSKISAFFGELTGKLGEAIQPTVMAQDTKDEPNNISGETVNINGFALPAGNKSVTIKFRATVNNGPYPSGLNNIDNTANVTNGGTINQNGTASIALDAAPDLQVTVSDGATTTQPGGVISYITTYQNNTATNGQDAAAVRVSQTVPINATFNAAVSGAGWSCPDGSPATTICTFDVGAVNAGATPASVNFAVNVLGMLPAGAVNVGDIATIGENPVNANGNDRVPANNSSTDTTNIIGNWDGSNSGDWHLAANWSNDVVPPAGNGISIPNAGNQPTITSADVSVNGLSLGRNVTINSPRTLSATGNVTLGAFVIDGAGTLSLGTASAITRTTGQVDATLAKAFAGPGPQFIFPVGTTGQYSPIDVTVTAGAGSLSARATKGTAPATPAFDATRMLQRYWTLVGTGVTSNIVFHYVNGVPPAGDIPATSTEASYDIFRVNTTTGVAHRFAPNGSTFILNAGADTFTVNGLSVYSYWTAGNPLAPTAAVVGISGRVLTADGRGVSGARVALTNRSGEMVYAMTNPFGFYRFVGVEVGQTYIATVDDKRHRYAARTLSVADEIVGYDFVPEP